MGKVGNLGASYTYNNARNNFATRGIVTAEAPEDDYSSNGTTAYDPGIDWARDDIAHVFTLHGVWDLPFLRKQTGWVAGVFGGWQLNTILNFQSGALFVPLASSGYGEGGDFNADGERNERPDRPSGDVAHSFTKDQWLSGPLTASLFPLPDTVRAGNLPRDFFTGPGYARADVAFVKNFPIPLGRAEKGRLQFRAEAFNLFNRINLSRIRNVLEAPNFGRPTDAYQMRTMQLAIKFLF